MLKKGLEKFDINVFKDLENSWAIVTTGTRDIKPNPMTVSWGGFGRIWNQDVCFIFIRKSRYTHDILDKTDSLSISFLDEKYLSDKALFGKKSGRDCNKFELSNLHAGFDPDLNTYIISEAKRVLKCKKIYSIDIDENNMPDYIKEEFYPKGDIHTMYICQIREYLDDEE